MSTESILCFVLSLDSCTDCKIILPFAVYMVYIRRDRDSLSQIAFLVLSLDNRTDYKTFLHFDTHIIGLAGQRR